MQNPDLALWRSVLRYGLTDAAAGEPADVAWLGSRDFAHVCYLAGVDPDAVLRTYHPARFKRLKNLSGGKRAA